MVSPQTKIARRINHNAQVDEPNTIAVNLAVVDVSLNVATHIEAVFGMYIQLVTNVFPLRFPCFTIFLCHSVILLNAHYRHNVHYLLLLFVTIKFGLTKTMPSLPR